MHLDMYIYEQRPNLSSCDLFHDRGEYCSGLETPAGSELVTLCDLIIFSVNATENINTVPVNNTLKPKNFFQMMFYLLQSVAESAL